MVRPVAYYPAQLPMSVIHQKKPKTFYFHHVEGYQDPSTWARVKGGVKKYTNFWTPCRKFPTIAKISTQSQSSGAFTQRDHGRGRVQRHRGLPRLRPVRRRGTALCSVIRAVMNPELVTRRFKLTDKFHCYQGVPNS